MLQQKSIIKFLTYHDMKALFHKLIDASDQVHDAQYILTLMEKVID